MQKKTNQKNCYAHGTILLTSLLSNLLSHDFSKVSSVLLNQNAARQKSRLKSEYSYENGAIEGFQCTPACSARLSMSRTSMVGAEGRGGGAAVRFASTAIHPWEEALKLLFFAMMTVWLCSSPLMPLTIMKQAEMDGPTRGFF